MLVNLGLKVSFYSKPKSRCGDSPQTSGFGFHSGFFWHSTTETHQSWPVRLTGNAYLIVWKVGVTSTFINKNEEQPRGFAERISKNCATERLEKIFLCVLYCLEQLFRYAILGTFDKIFRELHVIRELWNALWQNYLIFCIIKLLQNEIQSIIVLQYM